MRDVTRQGGVQSESAFNLARPSRRLGSRDTGPAYLHPNNVHETSLLSDFAQSCQVHAFASIFTFTSTPSLQILDIQCSAYCLRDI